MALDELLGDARGGVLIGPGSLDLAECTRCSSSCICAVSVRICVSDEELGKPLVAGALARVLRITEGVAFLFRTELDNGVADVLEPRKLPVAAAYRGAAGLGVVLESPEGNLSLLFGRLIGVFATSLALAEASDIGGDGGVRP